MITQIQEIEIIKLQLKRLMKISVLKLKSYITLQRERKILSFASLKGTTEKN